MQSGKISPIFRQFFGQTQSAKSATDSNSQQRQEYKEPEREPTQEEALAALDLLTHQDEFEKNSLRAELRIIDGRHAIIVSNPSGGQLRVIRGMDIIRLLQASLLGNKGHTIGRILDRRI